MEGPSFTHFDATGHPQMVNVSEKADSFRRGIAQAVVQMQPETRKMIELGQAKKGDVIAVAELAGIMGAKKTSDLIPLCHPLPITEVRISSSWGETNDAFARLVITAEVTTTYRTGVEMEALTACTTAALTVYDMCKAVDRAMSIQDVQLLRKEGGKSGLYVRDELGI